MRSPSRRYELLLPTSFNDGSAVPDALIGRTIQELRAVSVESQHIAGHWEHEGVTYRDANIRLFVDIEDTPGNRQFFVEFKSV
jgi:hypothetical protein